MAMKARKMCVDLTYTPSIAVTPNSQLVSQLATRDSWQRCRLTGDRSGRGEGNQRSKESRDLGLRDHVCTVGSNSSGYGECECAAIRAEVLLCVYGHKARLSKLLSAPRLFRNADTQGRCKCFTPRHSPGSTQYANTDVIIPHYEPLIRVRQS